MAIAALGGTLGLLLGSRADAADTDAVTVAAPAAAGQFQATIGRDSGIPTSRPLTSAESGFGYGYAFAEDNICTIAETYVTVRERSRYTGDGVEGTGPDGSYPQRGNGFGANNLNSDFFYQRIIDKGIIEDLLDDPAPAGPAPEIREGVRGYVAGYNKYLAETGVDNLPDPRCRGANWVSISEIDAYRRFYQLALLASQSVAIDGIARRKDPLAPSTSGGPGRPDRGARGRASDRGDRLQRLRARIRGERQRQGIVLGNPHFPWDGPRALLSGPSRSRARSTSPGPVSMGCRWC